MSLFVLFGVGLLLVLFKWAMDELFVHRPQQRPRRPSMPAMRGPLPAPQGGEEKWEDEL